MDRFIVGTGRCGSTLLSRMLAESPEVLSLSEFMNGLDMTRRFAPEPVAGKEFVWLLAQEHPFVTMVLRRGYAVPEIVYPFDRPGARYTREAGTPYLLGACLPRLSDDPDALFDALLGFAAELPEQPLARHYRAAFDWLAARLGRALWIERSGSSIDYLGELARLFPEARFLHLHRDGREAALSMREHAAFRLAICLTAQVLERGRTHSLAELQGLDAPGTDRISALLASRPDSSLFGRFWSDQVVRGFRALKELDASRRYREVRFEELVTSPHETLRTIAEFFEIDPERDGWIARAAALLRGVPAARAQALPADERERLDLACRPGQQLLGRAA